MYAWCMLNLTLSLKLADSLYALVCISSLPSGSAVLKSQARQNCHQVQRGNLKSDSGSDSEEHLCGSQTLINFVAPIHFLSLPA